MIRESSMMSECITPRGSLDWEPAVCEAPLEA